MKRLPTLTALTMTVAALLVFAAAANAQAPLSNTITGVDCSDTGFANAETQLGKMTDAIKRDMAREEVTMARNFMAKNDMEGCRVHIENAVRMMK